MMEGKTTTFLAVAGVNVFAIHGQTQTLNIVLLSTIGPFDEGTDIFLFFRVKRVVRNG